MKLRPDSDYDHNRAMAAAAHGVDLSVNVDSDMCRLQVPVEILDQVKAFVQKGYELQGFIGYSSRLKQVERMLVQEPVEALVASTSDQLKDVLEKHREIAPYEKDICNPPY